MPESIQFQTEPEIALDQIRRARERGIPQGVAPAAAGYGTDMQFRAELTKVEMAYVVGIQSTTTVWKTAKDPSAGTQGQYRAESSPGVVLLSGIAEAAPDAKPTRRKHAPTRTPNATPRNRVSNVRRLDTGGRRFSLELGLRTKGLPSWGEAGRYQVP